MDFINLRSVFNRKVSAKIRYFSYTRPLCVIKKMKDLNTDKIQTTEYFKKLVKEFPTLKEGIENNFSELIHFQMETFSDYTLLQIKNKNTYELKRCFEFQEIHIDLLKPELLNALTVSYCESLLLSGYSQEMPGIVNLMPPKLKKLYNDYQSYYENLANDIL